MTSQVEVPPLTGLIHFFSGKIRVKLLILTTVVLDGYATLKSVLLRIHHMQPFRPSAPIQEGTYFHTNTPLFIRK